MASGQFTSSEPTARTLRVRIAPTPSGYLHRGNAANALLCAWWARELGAALLLRVDDLDAARARPEYVTDIDEVLAWLDITPDERAAPQRERMADYAQARDTLIDTGRAFVCACSRRDLASGRPCACRSHAMTLETGRTSLRWSGPHGDVVVWRREGIPSYHLATVVDDAVLEVTHVVRGDDLAAATALQRDLDAALGQSGFTQATVVHHPLLVDDRGEKLSKSHLRSGPLPRTPGERLAVVTAAQELAAAVGITPSAFR